MNLGNLVFCYREGLAAEHHLANPLQPEIGLVTSVNEDSTVNVIGFTAWNTAFSLIAVPVQRDYDPENEGDFVTTSQIPTAAASALAKVQSDAKAAADLAATQAKAAADAKEVADAKALADAKAAADAKTAPAGGRPVALQPVVSAPAAQPAA